MTVRCPASALACGPYCRFSLASLSCICQSFQYYFPFSVFLHVSLETADITKDLCVPDSGGVGIKMSEDQQLPMQHGLRLPCLLCKMAFGITRAWVYIILLY